MDALTEWFDRTTKPHHIGAYQVRVKPNGKQLVVWYSWWTGKRWSKTAQTPHGAESCKDHRSNVAIQSGGFEWRGLANEPKGN
jgi:hypothetical protein